jgi:hypothetical protein
METEIRELLRERAEDVRSDPRIPPTVLRRARRRRAVTAVAAAGLTAGIVAAMVVGTRLALDGGSPEPRRGIPVGRLGEYDGIYPETATLRAIRAGHIPVEPWRTPQSVARMYAENVLGWEPSDATVSETYGRLRVSIANPKLGPDSRIRLAMERRGDVLTIRSAGSPSILIDHPDPADPLVPGDQLTISGRLESVLRRPERLSVEVSLTSRTTGSGVGTPAGKYGPFTLPLQVPKEIEDPPILAITLHTRSGETLTITSFRLAVDAEAPPAGTLPEAVGSTRAAIIDAARGRDWQTLRTLIPRNFSFSFGVADDPISYWKDLEAEGEPILDTLATLLEGPWAPNEPTDQGEILYVWPGPAVKPAEDWTKKDVAILRRTASEREIELYRDLGSFIGWRVGIWEDGTWSSFIAGD